MKNIRLHMIFQWVFFLPIILPLCIIYGALRGAIQMVERIAEQMMADIVASADTQHSLDEQSFRV